MTRPRRIRRGAVFPRILIPSSRLDTAAHGHATRIATCLDRGTFPLFAGAQLHTADAPVGKPARRMRTRALPRGHRASSCHGSDMAVTLMRSPQRGAYAGVPASKGGVTIANCHPARGRHSRDSASISVSIWAACRTCVFHRLSRAIKPMAGTSSCTGCEDILAQHELLGRIEVPFVIDHMGRVKGGRASISRRSGVARLYRRNPLAWIKICGAERCCREAALPRCDSVRSELLAADPARVLWGTDWPQSEHRKDMPNEASSWICWVKSAGIPRSGGVFGDNPTRMY